MRNIFLIPAVAFLSLIASQSAFSLDLRIGLSVEPPEQLDLTYQAIPAFDEKEKVIAGWSGKKLQYFVVVDKLPPGYLDATAYFSGLARDLRAAWGAVDEGKTISYRTPSGISGSAAIFSKPSNSDSRKTTVVVHFMTDGEQSFVAMATVIPPAAVGRVLEDTTSLFKTASVSAVTGHVERSEDELVGVWVGEETLPDGRSLVSTTELKRDLSFSTTSRIDDTIIFVATGVWSRTADRLYWEYLYSKPLLPKNKRRDKDRILSIQADKIELQSMLTGKKHIFKRSRVQAN